ncbi:hypothetical protein RFI_08269 [Reticulomyxa filosa]|uniref:Uncharacterized protein n=1 Tax=Reticulomyxa filosa TaxID=46433 RepID=X6NRD3_RETFI|nr:hypothetical protein RFI_08269 [Reticulomyxa filosa]|eukprot:ETO28855.1 hypothetical protein RFI_08269 [Reticulomyxa filosa]
MKYDTCSPEDQAFGENEGFDNTSNSDSKYQRAAPKQLMDYSLLNNNDFENWKANFDSKKKKQCITKKNRAKLGERLVFGEKENEETYNKNGQLQQQTKNDNNANSSDSPFLATMSLAKFEKSNNNGFTQNMGV